MLKYTGILVLALAVYWWVLSFHTEPLILILGAISIALVVGLVKRMNILDGETVPYAHSFRMTTYFGWLFKEIVKANVEVVKAVMSPELEVSPAMVKVPASPKTEIGKTQFANSITLTPGTVSVEIDENEILVHALLSEMSDPDGFSEMGVRSARSVGEKPSEGGA